MGRTMSFAYGVKRSAQPVALRRWYWTVDETSTDGRSRRVDSGYTHTAKGGMNAAYRRARAEAKKQTALHRNVRFNEKGQELK